MWIFLPNSFLSIVAPTPNTSAAKDDLLMVRGRVKGDIEKVFPDASVSFTPQRDYAFRALIPRNVVVKAIAGQAESIQYGNFKDEVSERDRKSAYSRVWSNMNDLQGSRGYGGMYNHPAFKFNIPQKRSLIFSST